MLSLLFRLRSQYLCNECAWLKIIVLLIGVRLVINYSSFTLSIFELMYDIGNHDGFYNGRVKAADEGAFFPFR